MKLFSSKLRKYGIFTKINITIILLMTCMTLLLIFLLNHFLLKPSLEKDKLLSEESALSLYETVLSKYNTVYNQRNLITSTSHIAGTLAATALHPDEALEFDSISQISTYLQTLLFSDSDILDAVILSLDTQVVYSRSAKPSRVLSTKFQDYYDMPEISRFLEEDLNICVFPAQLPPYVSSDSKQVITFAAKIYDPFYLPNKQLTGIFLINYPLSVFSDSYQHLGALSDGCVYVLNDAGCIVFSNHQEQIGEHYADIDHHREEITSFSVGISKIRILNSISEDAVMTATLGMVQTMLFVVIPSVLVMVFTILLLNRRYQQRINQLANAMQQIVNSDFHMHLPIQQEDEIGRLSQAFNRMCEKLDTNIRLAYQAELSRKTAELNVLQAQINPHFLFNTIESIRMRAAEDGNPDIAEMLLQLGQLFHWMIQMNQRIVYLEDEIDYNEAYLRLQKLRYNDQFDCVINIPSEALYLGVPKFTIQPIIGNAIRHGFRERIGSGLISITAQISDQSLYLRVSDNSCGIEQERLNQLQQHISGQNINPHFGIGLQNIHARIQMLFGKHYGVHVESQIGVGTTVTITLPAMPKKDMDNSISIEQEIPL